MKILFVYGYGGNPDSTFCRLIREALASPTLHGTHYDVCCYEYPQQDCAKAKECLEEIIGREGIDLVKHSARNDEIFLVPAGTTVLGEEFFNGMAHLFGFRL